MPHSEIRGSKGTGPSPRLIAACHVLHRLHAPRHPPNALLTLESSSISREQCFRSRVRTLCTNSVQTLHTLNTYPNTRPCLGNPFCITGSTHARQNTASKHGSLFLSMWCSWGLAVPTNTKRVIVIHSVKDQLFQPRQNGAKKSQSPFKKHKSAKRILARRTKRTAMVGPKGGHQARASGARPKSPRTTISSADGGPRWT